MGFGLLLSFGSLLISVHLPQAQSATLLPHYHDNINTSPVIQNANHIFNAVHSALRQWGSSLNHNGMSAFIARVPAGTQFYHGSGKKDPVTGMEWLAFEPEHAMMFAHQRFGRLPPPPPPGTFEECTAESLHACYGHGTPQQVPLQQPQRADKPDPPPPPPSPSGPPGPPGPPPGGPGTYGWLHTYATKHELRLLYIDGMSAGKTNNGTLDLQDMALLNGTYGGKPLPAMSDYERARGLCELAKTTWAGRIHGILRMEAGFEIILCDFADLDVLRIIRVGRKNPEEGPLGQDGFSYFRAIVDRYHGIGGGRATVDFNHFVTAYGFELDLFPAPGAMPRLLQTSTSERKQIKDAITEMVLADDEVGHAHDWQAVADMIVTRYSNRLQYMVSEATTTPEALRAELENTLRPFIDFDARNASIEIDRCTNHFLPLKEDTSAIEAASKSNPASVAIKRVSWMLCSNLVTALVDDNAGAAHERVEKLVNWLQWTTWKECRGCGYDEVCVVPIWPWGAKEDHDQPSCTNASSLANKHGGYWGNVPRRGPPPERPDLLWREAPWH